MKSIFCLLHLCYIGENIIEYDPYLTYFRQPSKSHLTSNRTRLIVQWTIFFNESLQQYAKIPLSQCPVKCIFTENKGLAHIADAVLFHSRDTNPALLPEVRHPFQRYIFFNMESPHHSGVAVRSLSKGFFNWTMTYRLDSDVHLYYDKLLPKDVKTLNRVRKAYSWDYVQNVAANKTKLVAQFVSNCNTPSRREKYVEELAKSVSVDIYGACSKNQCPHNQTEQCEKMITDDYMFYLAFENSVCLDYVTEKFWRLKLLIVPVVLRNSDYVNIAPKGSYIAVDQFESPTQLATYLNYLADNRAQYLKYFEWTKYYWHTSEMWMSFCDLCQALHHDLHRIKIYDNIVKWWLKQGNCQEGFAENLIPRRNEADIFNMTHSSSTTIATNVAFQSL